MEGVEEFFFIDSASSSGDYPLGFRKCQIVRTVFRRKPAGFGPGADHDGLNVDPNRQDDRRDPLPAQLLLDGEGRLVMEKTMNHPRLAENGLPGENR